MAGWEDTIEPVKAGSWEDTIQAIPLEEKNIPMAASAAAGAIKSVPFSHQIGALGKTAMDVITGITPVGDSVDEYRHERDSIKGGLDEAAAANPKTAFVGGLASAPFMPMAAGAKGMALYGGLKSLGDSGADLTKGQFGKAAADTALGAGTGYVIGRGVDKAVEFATPYVKSKADAVAQYLRSKAGGLAKTATGATERQANKFAENAGEELLDRGVVGFGDTQASIAKKAGAALEDSEGRIGDAVSRLTEKGVRVDRRDALAAIESEIQRLSSNEGEAATVTALENKAAAIRAQIPGSATEAPLANAADEALDSSVLLAKSEEIKRSFDRDAKWSSNSDNATLESNRIAANAYREGSEKAAVAAEPELAGAFKTAKQDAHLLYPIAEATERRAAANAQRMGVNLHSVGHGAAGAIIGGGEGYREGGLKGGLAGAAAGAILGPRAMSSSAAVVNLLSKAVRTAPEALGKYAQVLAQAATRGAKDLMFTDKILRETDPEYRQILGKLERGTASEGKK